MIKKTLYPKTKRIGGIKPLQLTEKLDGSNIGFFKFNGELYVAQRNYVFKAIHIFTIPEVKQIVYKGLYGFLQEHLETLQGALHETSCIFCEWIGMGKIKYPELDKRIYMFAKANVTGDTLEDLSLKNIYYDLGLFKWCFIEQKLPEFVGIVPLIGLFNNYPSVGDLDIIYGNYELTVDRDVEGFVILCNGTVTKYVRKKNGKTTEHKS